MERLEEIMKRFFLPTKEVDGADLGKANVERIIRDCQKSLIGKVIGEKLINFVGMKNFVNQVWGYPRNLKIFELGPNLFQFSFKNKEEMTRVFNGRPWIIDNQLIVLNQWKENIEYDKDVFNFSPIWIQVWDLPLHWLSKEVRSIIGGTAGEVLEVLLSESWGKKGKHLKVLVSVDITKPLMRGTIVKLNNKAIWARFVYERSPDFCYKYGLIGHSDRNCRSRNEMGRRSMNLNLAAG
ncbi:hypothetical protein ACH5RR_009970 [Cinchona calisaya]|uniref:DUF4283 domain-containing protein n=1 Tax=Cinchona calisaya TaxID=153742 RepID=A0ABD3AHB6_9GENT